MTSSVVSRQSGVALILVLWITVLLTVIAAGFAYSMRTEALAARNAVALAQARSLADGAVSRMAFELMRPRAVPETWQADGAVHYWQEDGASIAASALDESGKIDLNTAPDALLKNLFQTAAGADAIRRPGSMRSATGRMPTIGCGRREPRRPSTRQPDWRTSPRTRHSRRWPNCSACSA
jgi:type II secretory pathway component PulK